MGRLMELINKFIQPNEQDQSFDKLALASGVKPKEIKQLKDTQGGLSWEQFSGEEGKTRITKGLARTNLEQDRTASKSRKVQGRTTGDNVRNTREIGREK